MAGGLIQQLQLYHAPTALAVGSTNACTEMGSLRLGDSKWVLTIQVFQVIQDEHMQHCAVSSNALF